MACPAKTWLKLIFLLPRQMRPQRVTAIVSGYAEDKPTQGSTTTQVTTYDGTKIAKLVITTQQGQVLRTCTWDMTTTNPPTCSVP